MAQVVYLLSALTSLACAVLLIRGYLKTRVRFLLWSGMCFVGITLNNVLLYIDLIIIPTGPDLSMWRSIPALIGLLLLIYGMIWDAK